MKRKKKKSILPKRGLESDGVHVDVFKEVSLRAVGENDGRLTNSYTGDNEAVLIIVIINIISWV